RLVDEAGQLQLADLRGQGVVVEKGLDRAVGSYRDAAGTVGPGDAGLDGMTVDVDELAGGVPLEGAVTGIGGPTVGQLDEEEALAADGDVQFLFSRRHAALAHHPWRGDGANARSHLDADWSHGALVRGAGS